MRIILVLVLLIAMTSPYAGENRNSNVLIFVSFSMPKESIKGWMQEAEKIHAPVVIRGLVNNSFKATIQKMKELVNDNQGGVQIDPNLFRKFKIKQVPAVVVRSIQNCLPTQTCFEDYDVIYGNVHLDYALEKIANQNDVVSPIAKEALIILRESHHV